jgi:hypothetical protein
MWRSNPPLFFICNKISEIEPLLLFIKFGIGCLPKVALTIALHLKAYINSYPYFTHFLTDVSDEACYRGFPRNAIE